MNKQRFIERLNLHLDGELSEAESNELLSEIRENPEYHRIYIQYCQLFNACSALGSRFSEAKQPVAWRQKAYAIGGMAAAGALLFLAARNLTPVLDGFVGTSSEVVAANANPSQALGTDPSETLMVIDGSPLKDWKFITGEEGPVPAPFSGSDYFDSTHPFDFGTNSDVEFAHYINAERSVATPHWRKVRSDFLLEEAANESTYGHEMLVAEEENQFPIGSSSEMSYGDGESLPVRYEFEGTAAVRTPKN